MKKMNKEKFLKTELGGSLQECITAWDFYLGKRNLQNLDNDIEKSIYYCQAQWEVYQMAIKQFYGVEYNFTRTDEYFGLVTNDEDFLIKTERTLE